MTGHDGELAEPKAALAVSIADYVETHHRYAEMSKREAVVAAVGVLTGDQGAAQRYLDTLGVPWDLYGPEAGPVAFLNPWEHWSLGQRIHMHRKDGTCASAGSFPQPCIPLYVGQSGSSTHPEEAS